jgi:DNA-binding NarL/FixJ family response regulator
LQALAHHALWHCHRVRQGSRSAFKATVAPTKRFQPYSDTELLSLRRRLAKGTQASRTHALRLLATIDRDRSAGRSHAQTLAGARRGAAVEFGAKPLVELTPIQQRILSEPCRGQRTLAIAKLLNRSAATIHSCVRLLYAAFGVRTRAGLVAKAICHNLISVTPTQSRRT